jgi:hypothetical protein
VQATLREIWCAEVWPQFVARYERRSVISETRSVCRPLPSGGEADGNQSRKNHGKGRRFGNHRRRGKQNGMLLAGNLIPTDSDDLTEVIDAGCITQVPNTCGVCQQVKRDHARCAVPHERVCFQPPGKQCSANDLPEIVDVVCDAAEVTKALKFNT